MNFCARSWESKRSDAARLSQPGWVMDALVGVPASVYPGKKAEVAAV